MFHSKPNFSCYLEKVIFLRVTREFFQLLDRKLNLYWSTVSCSCRLYYILNKHDLNEQTWHLHFTKCLIVRLPFFSDFLQYFHTAEAVLPKPPRWHFVPQWVSPWHSRFFNGFSTSICELYCTLSAFVSEIAFLILSSKVISSSQLFTQRYFNTTCSENIKTISRKIKNISISNK